MKRRVLLVGWDAADWKVARPLMERGEMPNLARLVAEGASGNLATIYPVLSPMLWTSIATGKRPPKHGIHGFTEPLPDGSGVRPITTLGRKSKAIWNILNQSGLRLSVVGWWPSHPAEPVRGVMVSNHFHQAGEGPEPRGLLPGSVHPAEWAERLAELRVTPMELPGEALRLFVPEFERVDQDKDKRLHTLARILAETISLHAAATEVLKHADWDFAAVYYDSIDHFGHAFMSYHPPRLDRVAEEDFAVYRHVVANAYRHHDAMLGRLLELAGPETTVIVMSDHGFHPDHLRPRHIPAEAAGPAVEHRHFGMLTLRGPGIRAGETIFGACVLDVAPTVLHLFGLPVGGDMDGKVLVNALDRPGPIATVPSWDRIAGDDGSHPPEAQFDPVAASEAMKQFVALGYVAPPGEDQKKTVSEAVVEQKYNLARAHDDSGRPDRSIPLYEELRAGDPDDHRFSERLILALAQAGDRDRARAVLDEFDARCAVSAPAAEAELARRRADAPDSEVVSRRDPRQQREVFERRVLASRATGYSALRALLRLRLDLADGRHDLARTGLSQLEGRPEGHALVPALMMAQSYAKLRDDERALAWVDRALGRDPDDWQALALAARLHLRRRRFARALDAAAASLSLIYHQPVAHYVMGRALLARGDVEGAERSLRVAVSQMPGLVPAHETLARLYARQLGRPAAADLHRVRAMELRQKARDRRAGRAESPSDVRPTAPVSAFPDRDGSRPAEAGLEIVVVAGLPRSGTSMLMQLLAAGGVAPLTDGRRVADEDNPRGYFEFEPATRIARDCSWIPDARGRAVKLALPLVMHLPAGEAYRLVIVERDLGEVIASQRRMLERLGRVRDGAALSDAELAAEYRRHRERVIRWLSRRPELAVLPLEYDAILSDPRGASDRLAAFLGRPFDVDAAAVAVVPSIRRQRAAIDRR